MMTRKHYRKLVEDLADVHNRMESEEEKDAVSYSLSVVANTLAQDNPRFDRVKFHAEYRKLIS